MGCRTAGSSEYVNVVERGIRKIDGAQRRFTPTAFMFGVIKKFGDDNGGVLVANLTYSAFVTLFPLLLVFTTILGLVAAFDPGFKTAAEDAVANQVPLIGHTLTSNVQTLKRSSVIGLIVGLLVLIWGSMGLAQAGMYTMARVWNLPGPERPGYLPRLARSMLFLALLAVDVIATTALASLSTYGGNRPLSLLAFAEAVAAAVNAGMFVAGFRILTPKAVETHDLVRGAVIAGMLWTVFQVLGTWLVHHFLHSDSVYGVFATVLGLIAWLYLAARVTVYCAEINVVLARRLWPRSIVQPPLTEADRESLALHALESQQRVELQVHVSFKDADQPAVPGQRPAVQGAEQPDGQDEHPAADQTSTSSKPA
jgi:YihY family inner membrane protein